jgi:cytoskeletal protein CcmA (bactofilin family)
MGSLRSLAVRVSLGGLLFAALSASAFADSPHDRTQFGHDIFLGPGEEITEVTCFGCNVRIRGKVEGDATTFGGNILVEDQGEVGGDTTTFAGDVRLDKGAKISGVTVFAGRIHRDPGATVDGDVTTFSGSVWLVVLFGLPLVLLGGFIALIVWLIRRLARPAMSVAA